MFNATDSLLKVERAEYHLRTLIEAKLAYEKSACKFRIQPLHDTGKNVLIGCAERCPPTFGIIIGDVANNARSALDYIVNELSSLPPDSKGRNRIQFPIVDNEESFRQSCKKLLNGVDPALVDKVKSLQPYQGNGINAPLAVLREINNGDKHRKIRVVSAISKITLLEINSPADPYYDSPDIGSISFSCDARMSLEFGDGKYRFEYVGVGNGELTEHESQIAELIGSLPPDERLKPKIETKMMFAKPQPLIEGLEVIETLRLCIDRVKETVRQFA
jgi:hypothetical protein